MKALDLERELVDLAAKEEVLAFFDFVLTLPTASGSGHDVEGLCKVSRPRERRSRATYVSLLFIVDAQDAATRQALESHMKNVDWGSPEMAPPGVDCVLPVPYRNAAEGLFLKEIDVYLDGTRAPDTAFVREVLQPAVVRATGIRPGEITAWADTPEAPAVSEPVKSETLLERLRRLVGLEAG